MAKNTDDMVKLVAVYSTEDAVDLDMHLRMEKISCVRRKIGAGSHGNILLAMNNFGEEVFVYPEQEAEAKKILEQWRSEREQERKEADRELTAEEEEQQRKNQRESLLARIFAGAAAVILIAFFVNRMM